MNDEAKLKLAKMKLHNLKGISTLEELTLQKIAKKMDHFRQNGDQKLKLKSLPGSLRQKLLHEFTTVRLAVDKKRSLTEFENVLQSFELLLCRQTKVIRLNGLLTYCPTDLFEDNVHKVLQMIATQAPNILALTLNEIYEDLTSFSCFQMKVMSPRLEESVKRLEHLKYLKCNMYAIRLSGLMAICRSLRSLRFVEVIISFDGDISRLYTTADIESISVNIEDLKESFSHLTVLLFRAFYHQGYDLELPENYLASMCYKHLPNLKVVKSFASWRRYTESEIVDRQTLSIIKRSPETSALQHLCIVYPPNVSPRSLHDLSALSFPEVKHLKVSWLDGYGSSWQRLGPLLQFAEIKTLTLQNVELISTYHLFFDRYGPNLTELYIVKTCVELDFRTVFDSCPKLEKLTLAHANFRDHTSPIKFFSNLREFEWVPCLHTTVCLSNILMAPELECLTIDVRGPSMFEAHDLKLVSALIANRKILTQLKTFKVRFCCLVLFREQISMYYKQLTADLLPEWSDLLKNAAAFLPQLTKLNVQIFAEPREGNICSVDDFYSSTESAFEWLGIRDLFDFVESSINCSL